MAEVHLTVYKAVTRFTRENPDIAVKNDYYHYHNLYYSSVFIGDDTHYKGEIICVYWLGKNSKGMGEL